MRRSPNPTVQKWNPHHAGKIIYGTLRGPYDYDVNYFQMGWVILMSCLVLVNKNTTVSLIQNWFWPW